MDASQFDLASLTNSLMREDAFDRVAMITTLTTGTSTLNELELGLPSVFLSLQYADADFPGPGRQTAATSLTDLREYVVGHGLEGSIDLLIVDPHHTYRSSVECLEMSLALLRPGGVLLVHDCLPPFDMTDPEFVPGDWCGLTFAAFRDVCTARGLQWCTVDANYGIGVAAVTGPSASPSRVADHAWPDADAVAEMTLEYEDDPFAMMRAVAPEHALDAVARVRAGQSVEDLVREFTGVGPLVPGVHQQADEAEVENEASAPAEVAGPTAEVAGLTAEVERLSAELAAVTSALVEVSTRPSRQLQALGRSLPAAVQLRVNRLR